MADGADEDEAVCSPCSCAKTFTTLSCTCSRVRAAARCGVLLGSRCGALLSVCCPPSPSSLSLPLSATKDWKLSSTWSVQVTGSPWSWAVINACISIAADQTTFAVSAAAAGGGGEVGAGAASGGEEGAGARAGASAALEEVAELDELDEVGGEP